MPIKLLLVGLDAAGKTTILYKWSLGEVATVIPTIGFNVESATFRGSIVTAWDVGGRSKIRPLRRHYYKNTDAVIFVVDSNDSDRLDQARDELHRDILNEKDLKDRPLLVFCNKQDLPNALSADAIASCLGIIDDKVGDDDAGHTRRPCRVMPCVATTGKGIDKGFQWLCDTVRQAKATTNAEETSVLVSPRNDRGPVSQSMIGDEFEPVKNNATLKHFRPIQQGTECPFAKAAKLWGSNAGPWYSSNTARTNAAALTEFVRRSNDGENLDGFCIELPGDGGPETLGHRIRSVLTDLSDCDPAGEKVMRKTYIGARGWRFRFAKADFFVTSFAPCYPPTSSRYAFGTGCAFLLLQPEMSFLRHKLPDDTAVTLDPPQTIRDATRLAFCEAGRSYYIPKTTKYPPAEQLVKPIKDDGTKVIRWWIDRVADASITNEAKTLEEGFVYV